MNELAYLIQLTHPTAIDDARADIEAYPENLDEAAESVLYSLSFDDTFNGYSEAELMAAINETLTA